MESEHRDANSGDRPEQPSSTAEHRADATPPEENPSERLEGARERKEEESIPTPPRGFENPGVQFPVGRVVA